MSEQIASLPKKLFEDTLQRTVDNLGLVEQLADGGGPYMPLECLAPVAEGIVGNVRLFTGKPLFRLVTCSIVIPAIQLDSHMLFAFTAGDSAVPHFTLDSVKAGNHYAYHLDLIPRLDLGANLPYMQEVYAPLTEVFEAACAIDGLSKAHLSPFQYAIMSPWMLAHRATEEAFESIRNSVQKYNEHWFSLLQNGVSKQAISGVSSEQLQQRNKRNKALLFSSEVDPVWERISMLLGADVVAKQRALLIGGDE